jgi:xanthine dehydrogenase accessory factor
MKYSELVQTLTRQNGVLVTVHSVDGSGPREVGAWMAVFKDSVVNTIGGGHLEFQAMAEGRALLARTSTLARHDTSQTAGQVTGAPVSHEAQAVVLRYALGPSLGQCCGGVVHLRFEPISLADVPQLQTRLQTAQRSVALFGGGHVGRALVDVLGRLPVRVHWVDSRDEIFPDQVPPNVQCEHSHPVQDSVADVAPDSAVLIMSFSHAEDLDVVAACLKRQRQHNDLAFIGLIGSRTKWATFRHRLQERGFSEYELARVTCPIGVPGIGGKAPEVIAVAVAAQLLQLPSWQFER